MDREGGWFDSNEAHQIHGGLAQLGEHILCTDGVSGSSPLASTNSVASRQSLVVSDRRETRIKVFQDFATERSLC